MMKNKDEIRDELNELSPFLAKQKKVDEGFKVPSDYFQSLPDEVLKKVRPQTPLIVEPQRNWMDGLSEFIQNLFQPKYALTYASVALLIVAGGYFLTQSTGSSYTVASLENISDEVLESYLTENVDGISTDLLEAHFAEGSNEDLPGLELEEMENYLDNTLEDIDLEDLEDLL